MKKLIIFDFDGTLYDTPTPEIGKDIWLSKTGSEWKHKGWWGKRESIDSNIFEINTNIGILNEFRKHESDSDNHIILATGRLDKVKDMRTSINDLLERDSITFHDVYLSSGGDTIEYKINLFNKLIEDINATEVIIYEDRDEHIEKFIKWSKDSNIKLSIFDAKLI